MGVLNINDIFQIAMEIEKKGKEFYNSLSQKFEENNKKISDLYKNLSDEEEQHYQTFKELLESVKSSNHAETFNNLPDEYKDYLNNYTDKIIFTKGALKKEIERISNVSQAIDQSIRRELDSILYYQEIKDMFIEKDKEIINKIIIEERKHFLRLSNLK